MTTKELTKEQILDILNKISEKNSEVHKCLESYNEGKMSYDDLLLLGIFFTDERMRQ